MCPPDQDRKRQAIPKTFNAGREEADELPRVALRPDQQGAHATAEDGRGCDCECRLVENVRLEGSPRKRSPLGGHRAERGERPPFHLRMHYAMEQCGL